VRSAAARADTVIRIDAAWVAVEPLDMRAGVDTALARVVSVFGSARSHHAYLFLNRRSNRLKVLVHDGFGLWLCARRLQQGQFVRPDTHLGSRLELTNEQLRALVVGLPWQRLGEHARISVL
jgi:transposase